MGVITYEMLTATHPFRRRLTFSDHETLADALFNHPSGITQLSKSAETFFQVALASDRVLRPSEASAFLTACEQALQ
jgi:hypothetical protein